MVPIHPVCAAVLTSASEFDIGAQFLRNLVPRLMELR